MACYKPLLGKPYTDNTTGNTRYNIVKYDQWSIDNDDSCITIPCGKCIGCRLEYSRQWANRCMLEATYHENNYFITLTYNDECVPLSYYTDKNDNIQKAMTLKKRDYQLFMKRLRKHYNDQKIRYYACGEYGDKTYRPHYHAIIYGLEIHDLTLYKRSKDGYNYYNSKTIEKIWYNGHVVITQVTWDTCAYTARYMVDKLKGPAAIWYTHQKIEPPFSVMSRKPGIARQYYEDNPDLWQSDYIHIGGEQGGKKFRPPKYFERLLGEDKPIEHAELKAVHQAMAKLSQQAIMQNSDLEYLDILKIQENNKTNKIKQLERKLK